jgi:hypothetical protein
MARLFVVSWFTFPQEEALSGRHVFEQGAVSVKTENGHWPTLTSTRMAVFDDMTQRKIDISVNHPVISLPVPVSEADADAYFEKKGDDSVS